MKNALILLNYNDTKRIFDLIKKFSNSDFFQYIIVSDNNSCEDMDLLESFQNQKIILLKNNKNLWYSGGNNVALNYLKNKDIDYVFLFNSDIDVSYDVLEKSIFFLEENKDFSIVSPLMNEYGNIVENYYNFPTILNSIKENLGLKKFFKSKVHSKKINDHCLEVDYIRSSFWCVKYNDFIDIDFFDESTKLYHVETCVGLKLRKKKKKCAILLDYSYDHNHVYKKGYKITAYKDSYKSLKYVFKTYLRKNVLQMFCFKVSFYIGLFLRKIFNIK